MKKLAVVLALAVSGFVNAQDAYDIDQYKRDCNCDSAMAVGIHNVLTSVNNWVNNTHTFKTGDTDKYATIGILKDIYTDPTAKFKYAKNGNDVNVLVDDFGKYLNAWSDAGGIAVKHEDGNTNHTISELEKIYAPYLNNK